MTSGGYPKRVVVRLHPNCVLDAYAAGRNGERFPDHLPDYAMTAYQDGLADAITQEQGELTP